MKLRPFRLERYFAAYEFSARYLLSSSDCEGLLQSDLLALADDEMRQAWDQLKLGYTESLGHPMLRAEIGRLYTDISADQSLVIVPEEGIFLALNAILEQGDHVICTFPGYQSLYEIAEAAGCEVTKWSPEENNAWRFKPDFLEENIRPNTKLLVVNFPHNPTGYLPSREDYLQIVGFARRHNLYLFSDEMYRFLEYDPNTRLPSACEVYEKAVTLFGMSKTFGLAGVRIGWLITRDNELLAKMAALKDYTTICSSAPSEILSIIALRAKDAIITGHLQRIQNNVALLDEFFAKFPSSFDWVRPTAGTIAFPRLKGDINSLEFCRRAVEDAGIMLLPSTVYDYDSSHVRIGFGRANMPEALDKLEEYLLATLHAR